MPKRPKTSSFGKQPACAVFRQPVRVVTRSCYKPEMALHRILIYISHSEHRVLDPDYVYYLQARGGETEVRLRSRTPLIDVRPIGEVAPLFELFGFVRIHREHAVNLSRIRLLRLQADGRDWSGARSDREGLSALVEAARAGQFEAVLVDDLSRLARDNYLMLSVLAELTFEGVRVVSVADGLDSGDEDSTLAIQIRGIFNELQLHDLKKKTLRGQMGQKHRGFTVGERTFGYRSVPVGEIRMDKKGRPRPEGYRMEIEPREAAVVLRIFQAYGERMSLTRVVRMLNEEGVPGRFRTSKERDALEPRRDGLFGRRKRASSC